MKRTHNLRTVAWYEFRRTISKRGFWVATLAVPILYILLLALASASHSTAATDSFAQIRFEYTDESQSVDAGIAQAFGGTPAIDEVTAVAAVRDGRLDAYIFYPADPIHEQIRVYGHDLGIFANPKYGTLARSLLQQSAAAQVRSPRLAAALVHAPEASILTYRDGHQIRSLETAMPALAFFAVFFMLVSVLANHALNCIVEEKENRVAEMLLLFVRPDAFIAGKIAAILAVGAVQITVFAIPLVIGYAGFRDQLSLPDLSPLAADPALCALGTLLMLTGFALVMTLLVALSAAIPTARDGAPYYSALMIIVFSPVYALSTIISDPTSPLTQILLFFPPTAPMTALLMNAFGTLVAWQGITVTVELALAAATTTLLAVHLFRTRALGHSQVPVASLLRPQSATR